MKICGIICEFNPFHNGHKYLLERARQLSGCDFIVCIMSGNFTQRGEAAILNKYVRASHAALSGADCVIELPTAFAVAPAEIFAKGAVKILASIPNLKAIAFGCETPDKKELIKAAIVCTNETDEFKNILFENLGRGEGYIKSYAAAFTSAGGNAELIQNSNNILAVEYVKNILKMRLDIEIFPVKRLGSDYNDGDIKENFSSASAIRQNIDSPLIVRNVPECVLEDLKTTKNHQKEFEKAVKLILSRTAASELKRIYGCGEGLENALKNLENEPYEAIIHKATSKRYSSSRIKRILCSAFLGIYKEDCEKFLASPLYLTPLAVKKSSANEIFALLSKSAYPLITSGSAVQELQKDAKKCKETDDFASKQYRQITQTNFTDKLIIV